MIYTREGKVFIIDFAMSSFELSKGYDIYYLKQVFYDLFISS